VTGWTMSILHESIRHCPSTPLPSNHHRAMDSSLLVFSIVVFFFWWAAHFLVSTDTRKQCLGGNLLLSVDLYRGATSSFRHLGGTVQFDFRPASPFTGIPWRRATSTLDQQQRRGHRDDCTIRVIHVSLARTQSHRYCMYTISYLSCLYATKVAKRLRTGTVSHAGTSVQGQHEAIEQESDERR
jgi:hypothetical protein